MSAQPFVLTPDSYPAPLSVVGVNITVLASAETTQGYEVTFQQGDAVKPADFTAFSAKEDGFAATLPPKSVVVLTLE